MLTLKLLKEKMIKEALVTGVDDEEESKMTKKILVVDDDKGIRGLFQTALAESGYQLETAESGEIGLEMTRESDYSLIYLDLMMPGIDGVETLRRLREKDDSVPIYIITAFKAKFSDRLESAKQDGIAFEIMDKPFGSHAIVDITTGVLEGHKITFSSRAVHEFTLYISGETNRSIKTIADLEVSLEQALEDRYTLNTVDVLKDPSSAYENDVIATPTLIMTSPQPEKRFIGDFDKSQFLNLL